MKRREREKKIRYTTGPRERCCAREPFRRVDDKSSSTLCLLDSTKSELSLFLFYNNPKSSSLPAPRTANFAHFLLCFSSFVHTHTPHGPDRRPTDRPSTAPVVTTTTAHSPRLARSLARSLYTPRHTLHCLPHARALCFPDLRSFRSLVFLSLSHLHLSEPRARAQSVRVNKRTSVDERERECVCSTQCRYYRLYLNDTRAHTHSPRRVWRATTTYDTLHNVGYQFASVRLCTISLSLPLFLSFYTSRASGELSLYGGGAQVGFIHLCHLVASRFYSI